MPTLNSLRFDTTGWEKAGRDRRWAVWVNDHGDDLIVLLEHGPPGTPAVGDPGPALREALHRAAGDRIQLVAVERREVAGVQAIASLVRVPKGTGFTYSAGLMLPFARFTYSFLVTAQEEGITGVREAAAALMQHLAGRDYRQPLTPDQEQLLDAALPAHPLARVRTYLDELIGSLTLGPELAGAPTWPDRLAVSTGILEVRGGEFRYRRKNGRLVGRFPGDAVHGVRLDATWNPPEILLTFVLGGGAVLAWMFLGGFWAFAAAGVLGFLTLLTTTGWKALNLELDTPAGPLRWRVEADRGVAEGFRDYLVSVVPSAEVACPPSS